MTRSTPLEGGQTSRGALVVVDMQNDFCLPTSPLFVAGAPTAIPHVIDLVARFRAADVPVVWVMRFHRPDGSDVDSCRRTLFAQAPFLAESPGKDLVEGLSPCPDEVVIVKRRWSAFMATDLDLVLRRMGITALWIAGVQTPNCIRATAVDAVSLDYDCTVISDATASATDAVQRANLYDMSRMGITVTAAADCLPMAASAC